MSGGEPTEWVWPEEVWAQVHEIAGVPDTRPDWLKHP